MSSDAWAGLWLLGVALMALWQCHDASECERRGGTWTGTEYGRYAETRYSCE